MAAAFDPELVESTMQIDADRVDVYKVGGGTLGRAYEGLWGYRLTQAGEHVASGVDLFTGTPKTHHEAAQTVLEILDPQESPMTAPLRAAQLPVKYERAEGPARYGRTIYEVAGSGLYQVTAAKGDLNVSTLTQSGWTALITLDEGDGVSSALEAMQVWLDIQTPTPPAGDSAAGQEGRAGD